MSIMRKAFIISLWDIALIIMAACSMTTMFYGTKSIAFWGHCVCGILSMFEFLQAKRNAGRKVGISVFVVLVVSNFVLFLNVLLWTMLRTIFSYKDKRPMLFLTLLSMFIARLVGHVVLQI